MNLTNLMNFYRLQDKPFSNCLRIAADLIEQINESHPEPLINQYPEYGYEIDGIFRKLCQYSQGVDLVEQSKYGKRKVSTR